MKDNWKKINRELIIKAIEWLENTDEKYPKPRNTFLVYNGKEYPAKHIRYIAYKIANGKEIKKSEFNGGAETVNFFQKLGFDILYKNKNIHGKKITQPKKETSKVIDKKTKEKTNKKKTTNPIEQKNALKKLLEEHFGVIETEKKFDWLKTPDINNLPKEYKEIFSELTKYRNQTDKIKSNYSLLCDIVLDNEKIIIEYDENQHFTKAREITLLHYPGNVKLFFDKDYWIENCRKINAKDNNPIDRDEKRAFYDTVRDIEAYKNGYKLYRIKHNDIDWRNPESITRLKKIINI